ncbi:MAG: hypothetical protein WCP03_01035 [Candidatus Saccharibacteria bacterium]
MKTPSDLSNESTPQIAAELLLPIPEVPPVDGWKQIEIQENGEPLTPIGLFSGRYRGIISASAYGEDLDINSCYGSKGIEGGLTGVYLREEVAKKISEAQELLPKNLHFVVYDAYRPMEVQKALYDQYANALREKYPDKNEEDIEKETALFVSLPSTDPTKPSTHNTGSSVDLAIFYLPDQTEDRVHKLDELIGVLDKAGNWQEIYPLEMERHALIAQNAQMLNFGTKFDYGNEETKYAYIDYYEKVSQERDLRPEEIDARDNRRMLYNIMKQVGGEAFPSEWWHFNFDNQMAAVTSSRTTAKYGAAILSLENIQYEINRHAVLDGTDAILSAIEKNDAESLASVTSLGVVGKIAITGARDIRKTRLPQIEKIEP